MRCLVAGGAGFIGSHLIDALVARGDDVVVVDNLSTGSLKNIASSMESVEFVESDIRDLEVEGGFDRVYHLACIANPSDYISCPMDVLSSASEGTCRLLRIAERSGADFCYFSSSEVYGDQPRDG